MTALPPDPGIHPAMQMLRWTRAPFELLDECHERCGDAFSLKIVGLGCPLVIVSDPEVVKGVFGLGPDAGHAGKANFLLKAFLGEHSLLLLDGAEHMRQRKMMMPAFHGERMHAYGKIMLEATHDSVDAWPEGRPFPVHRPMQQITLQIILRTVFGVAEGPRLRALADALTRALDLAGWPMHLFGFMQKDLGRLSPWGRFVRHMGRSRDILREEIREANRAGTKGRADVLAMMVDAKDEAGKSLTEDELVDELGTLLVAGHETTATSLAWAMRWILADRPLLGRLIDEIGGASGDPLRLSKLELLDATVKEALRVQPVIPMVGRVLMEPATFGPLSLPAGVMVAPSIYLVHHRKALYPDASRFKPERFLGWKPAPWEFLPFGGGLRRCIGATFAIYEMKMVLAAVLPRVSLHLASDRITTQRRGITLTPSDGLPILVTRKRSRESMPRAA
jgi:cytochrome P450